jgi:hypothetical protein
LLVSLNISSTDRRSAHRSASTQPVATIAAEIQQALGPSLASVVLGMRDPKAIGAWAKGTRTPRPAQEQSLRALSQIISMLASAESTDVIRAWFGGMNPDLDDRAPAIVFQDDAVAVLRAAEAFLLNG